MAAVTLVRRLDHDLALWLGLHSQAPQNLVQVNITERPRLDGHQKIRAALEHLTRDTESPTYTSIRAALEKALEARCGRPARRTFRRATEVAKFACMGERRSSQRLGEMTGLEIFSGLKNARSGDNAKRVAKGRSGR